MIIKEIFSKFKDKLHFFRIQGVFKDQGHFQGLFKVCANPALRVDHFERAALSRKANRKSQKLFPFIKMIENHGDVLKHLR